MRRHLQLIRLCRCGDLFRTDNPGDLLCPSCVRAHTAARLVVACAAGAFLLVALSRVWP